MSLLGGSDIKDSDFVVTFNQNSTSLAVASRSGFNLYNLGSIDTTLYKIFTSKIEDIFLIERLFESSLVAMVSQRNPRKLVIFHFKKQSEICNYLYPNTILAIKLNRDRVLVCLEESLYIHNIQNMKLMHTIRETPGNSTGVCALSPSSEHCFLAYPSSITTGAVQIFDTLHVRSQAKIQAHDTPLAAICFNSTGREIATASERGTVIRVFSVMDGLKLFELHRGLKRCVSIASLSFSSCDEYLVSSSNTETVHIFRLDRSISENAEQSQSSDNWIGFLSKTVTGYLPSQVAEVLNRGRAYASVTLPEPGIRRICAVTTIQKELRLLVASQDGFLYVFSIPSIGGGECQLIKKHDLRSVSNHAMVVKVEYPQPFGGNVGDDCKTTASGSRYPTFKANEKE